MFSRILKEWDSASELWDKVKNFRTPSSESKTESIVDRFIQLFQSHGVHRNQIPRFFGRGISVADMQDEEMLLSKLAETVLDDVCEMFAVRREWLDGAEAQIYPKYDFYKKPREFLEFLESMKSENSNEIIGVLIKPDSDINDPCALVIIQETIGYLGDKPIFRFHLCNNWAYSYWRARGYLTACIGIAWKRSIYIHGIEMAKDSIDKLAYGETLLGWGGEGIWDLGHKTWNPEDMASSPPAFLEGIKPEENEFGVISALKLWLALDEGGLMDSGYGKAPREAFEMVLAKHT